VMELFIQIRDNQPYEHPILADNFRQAFPQIDTNHLPAEFARFYRVPPPNAGVYEVVDGPVYQWVDGVVKDVWSVRPMTAEEKQAKISAAMAQQPFPSWVFNEESCSFTPPVPYPTDGNAYQWDESTTSWEKQS
jgi:hypothetical protein